MCLCPFPPRLSPSSPSRRFTPVTLFEELLKRAQAQTLPAPQAPAMVAGAPTLQQLLAAFATIPAAAQVQR
jgi:hypothetical protein